MFENKAIVRHLNLMFFALIALALTACQAEESLNSSGPFLRASVDAEQVVAGSTVSVQCSVVQPTGQSGQMADALVLVEPAAGIEINGQQFVAQVAGNFKVRCKDPAGVILGSVPASVQVLSGDIAGTRVSFDPPAVAPGAYSQALCEAVDTFGNMVPSDPASMKLVADAEAAADQYVDSSKLNIEGMAAYGTIAGMYSLKCDLLSSDSEVAISGELEVVPGEAKEIRIALDPAKTAYEVGEVLTLDLAAYDAWGNRIENADISELSFVPEGEGLILTNNTSVETAIEGNYRLSAHLTDAPEIKGELNILVDGHGPSIELTSPEQAARLSGEPLVVVEGTISDSMGLITQFSINGEALAVPENGTFAEEIEVADGINAIVVEATDAHGRMSREVRWIVWSSEYQPISPDFGIEQNVDGGMKIRFGQNGLDDGDHDPSNPDDLATVFEIALAELSIEEMLGGLTWPILGEEGEAFSYSLAFQTAEQDPPTVSLTLGDGHLVMQIKLERVYIETLIQGECYKMGIIEICPPNLGLGSIDIAEALITFKVVPTLDSETSEIAFEVLETESVFNDVVIEGEAGLAEIFDDLNNLVNSDLKDFLELYLADMIRDELSTALQGLIQGWEVSKTLDVPSIFGGENMEILFESTLTDVSVSEEAFVLNSSVLVQDPSLRVTDAIGAFQNGVCGESDIPAVEDVQLGLKDALVNRGIHLLWANGMLDADLQLSAEAPMNAVCGFGGLVNLLDADPKTSVSLTAKPMLPPVLNSCAVMPEEEQDFGIQFGPVQIDVIYVHEGEKAELSFQMGFGTPMGQKVGALELTTGVPTATHVNWVDNSGINRMETKSLVEGLESVVEQYLAPGMSECLGGMLAVGPINAQAFVPAAEGVTLVPEFEEMIHQAQTLWLNGIFL